MVSRFGFFRTGLFVFAVIRQFSPRGQGQKDPIQTSFFIKEEVRNNAPVQIVSIFVMNDRCEQYTIDFLGIIRRSLKLRDFAAQQVKPLIVKSKNPRGSVQPQLPNCKMSQVADQCSRKAQAREIKKDLLQIVG